MVAQQMETISIAPTAIPVTDSRNHHQQLCNRPVQASAAPPHLQIAQL